MKTIIVIIHLLPFLIVAFPATQDKPAEVITEVKAEVMVKPLIIETSTPVEAKEETIQQYAERRTNEEFGEGQFPAFDKLIGNESGWMAGRLNKSSLACSIGQSLPCTKIYPEATKEWIMANKVEIDGRWYLPNPDSKKEVDWTIDYVKNRYGNPTSALNFWLSKSPHWY